MKLRLDHIPGPEISVAGESYLYFGGTAYLGVQHLPAFRALLAEATLSAGTHWGASRGGNVVVNAYARAERKLAAWTGSQAALTLSSGFLAGRLLTDYFSGPAYGCFYSPSCHAALLPPGASRAKTWEALQAAVAGFRQNHPQRQVVVFTDTLDFQRGPGPVTGALKTLPAQNCLLVADDSHGLGVLGAGGRGAYAELMALGFRELLVCASLGKALGVTAGVVLGSAARLGELEQTPLFSGASPAPPASVLALTEALDSGLYAGQLEHLQRNMAYFGERLRPVPGLQQVAGHPVWTFRDPALAAGLFENHIVVTHFDYPAEGNTGSPSRIVLTAAHRPEQLNTLALCIGRLKGITR